MPMEKKEDYPGGDESKDYCVHCAREDGSMKSYDEAVVGMTHFLIQSQGLDEKVANDMAIKHLSKMPAWCKHKGE